MLNNAIRKNPTYCISALMLEHLKSLVTVYYTSYALRVVLLFATLITN